MIIKNTTLFFVGIIVLILGVLVILFDYPQIQFFENMDSESYYLLDENERSIHQRLIIEFAIGIIISITGLSVLVGSLLKRFEDSFTQR
ncbi:MAG: hypothetical protein ACRBB2_05810 [Nitrosopumilus sp.]